MRNIKSYSVFEMNDDDENMSNDVYRLTEILEEIENLMSEANDIVRSVSDDVDPIIYDRWRLYPYNNIMSMLSAGSRYDTSFSDIISDIEKAMSDEEED
jgi:hypothetical protein